MSTHASFYQNISDQDFEKEIERIEQLNGSQKEDAFWRLMSQIWQEERYPAYFYANYEPEILTYIHTYLGHDVFYVEPMSKRELNIRINQLVKKTGVFSDQFVSIWPEDEDHVMEMSTIPKISASELNKRLQKFEKLFKPLFAFSNEEFVLLNEHFICGLKKIFAGYFFHRSNISRTTFNQYSYFIEASCDTMDYGDLLAVSYANEAIKDKKNAFSILYHFGEKVNSFSIESINRVEIVFHPINDREIKIVD